MKYFCAPLRKKRWRSGNNYIFWYLATCLSLEFNLRPNKTKHLSVHAGNLITPKLWTTASGHVLSSGMQYSSPCIASEKVLGSLCPFHNNKQAKENQTKHHHNRDAACLYQRVAVRQQTWSWRTTFCSQLLAMTWCVGQDGRAAAPLASVGHGPSLQTEPVPWAAAAKLSVVLDWGLCLPASGARNKRSNSPCFADR